MRKFQICFFILSLLLCNNLLAKWEQIIYDPTCFDLNSVAIASENVAAAVGEYGSVRITTDAGINWSAQFVPGHENLNNVLCHDEFIFLAAGEKGTIYKTTNRGISWLKASTGVDDDLKKIAERNKKWNLAIGSKGSIVKSEDWGETWNVVREADGYVLNDIAYYNLNNVFAVGDGIILKSSNMGDSWESMDIGYYGKLQKIKVLENNRIAIITDSLSYIYSDDAGQSWNSVKMEQNFSPTFRRPQAISFDFYNENEGTVRIIDRWSSFPEDWEYRTTDGGLTWTGKDISGGIWGGDYGSVLLDISLYSKDIGFGVGYFGNIYKITVNSNLNYIYQRIISSGKPSFRGIAAASAQDFAAISYDGNAAIYLWLTDDAGSTWKKIGLHYPGFDGGTAYINNVSYPSKNNILISFNNYKSYTVGNTTTMIPTGFIVRTTDGGNTFTEFRNQIARGFSEVYMANENYGYIFQNGDSLKYTTNGGDTWEDLLIPDTSYFNSKAFSPEPGVFFFILGKYIDSAYKYELFRTLDNGATWKHFQDNPITTFTKFWFSDRYNGWGLGRIQADSLNSKLYYLTINKTTDGGDSWFEVFRTDSTKNGFSDLQFAGRNNAMVAGSYCPSLFTSDCGDTWEEQSVDFFESDEYIRNVAYADYTTAMAITTKGKILINRNLPTGINEQPELEQFNDIIVFPNPSTNISIIKYYLSESCDVNLSLYNELSQEVAQLINKHQKNGEHYIQIPIEKLQLTSGMYFIRLQAGSNIKTVSLSIIK